MINYKTMNNNSLYNESLISHIRECHKRNKLNVKGLYWIIINNTCGSEISEYKENVIIDPNDRDRLLHYGSDRFINTISYPNKWDNIAKALKVLRKIMPYGKACYFLESDNLRSDSFYHVINDFKYKLNSDWYTLFNFEKKVSRYV